MNTRHSIPGRIAAYFQTARITPLLALTALLLGAFAMLVTPREEEPQINATIANVIIPFPGASVADVEQMVAIPAEQAFARIADIEHTASVSRPGVAVLTVQFKVGIPRTEALVRLYDTASGSATWLPQGMGVQQPLVKPMGIDDVPIVSLTLYADDGKTGAYDLERVAHSIEADIKHVPGTRDVVTIGAPGRGILVDLDPARMAAAGLTVSDLRTSLQAANLGLPVGDLVTGNRTIAIDGGTFLQSARDVGEIVVAARNNRPIVLQDIATVRDGARQPARYVWHGIAGKQGGEYPALTISVTKKPGENAVDVANAVMRRVASLENTVIPANIHVAQTRNYGVTANAKAQKLIRKLMFAVASVMALAWLALGRRDALVVGLAVTLTLAGALFASWAWGFTLNRVSLFALIFSIGILVDDAIVVVENIHRHAGLAPHRPITETIPLAVGEVGGSTILATLTVIAALLPMAFVSGLMGPYMSPIPINASIGMLLSLAIAFTAVPWLVRAWHKDGAQASHANPRQARFDALIERIFRPLLDDAGGARRRRWLALAVGGLILASLVLPATGLVQLKMLPFDDKSEFQVVVDMPAGTPLEMTASVLHELGAYLATVPDVTDYQAYAGTAAPINFNGLVRQYYLRASSEYGDIQVNLKDHQHRSGKSHLIATRLRPELQRIGRRFGANIKIVEVPPGPPVLASIVAEIYGPDANGRQALAKAVRAVFEKEPGAVDIDDSSIVDAPRKVVLVDRHKAALLGVSQQDVVMTLRAGLAGEQLTYLHDASKYPAPVVLQLPPERHGDLDGLLRLTVRSASGKAVPVGELVTISDTRREQPVYRKDLLALNYVVADAAGAVDSPLYAQFSARGKIAALAAPDGGKVLEYFIRQPEDSLRNYAIKWDGEWQTTYETFRDMGAAYAVGLVLIYLLIVAHFGSYLTPLIIMAPIPLTIIGVLPGHALLGAPFTATSMIGMIALAGIIVRNSILLVDFINVQAGAGVTFRDAVAQSAVTRARPILLTGAAAMLGALFILDDPIFNGLAISLIFGILVSTVLTLVVIPLLYFAFCRGAYDTMRVSAT